MRISVTRVIRQRLAAGADGADSRAPQCPGRPDSTQGGRATSPWPGALDAPGADPQGRRRGCPGAQPTGQGRLHVPEGAAWTPGACQPPSQQGRQRRPGRRAGPASLTCTVWSREARPRETHQPPCQRGGWQSGQAVSEGVGVCPPGVPGLCWLGTRTPGFCAACRLCVAHGKPLSPASVSPLQRRVAGSRGGFKRGTVL